MELDNQSKTIIGTPYQIIEPEQHGDYFFGKFRRRLRGDHRVMQVSTLRPQEMTRWERFTTKLPLISKPREHYTVITTDESIQEGEPYLFTIQPIDLRMMWVIEEVKQIVAIED